MADDQEISSSTGEQSHALSCAIVGRGRVGSSFATALGGCGWSIDLVAARSLSPADSTGAVATTLRGADVVLFAVPDDVIAAVARRVADLTGGLRGIAAHVSGASDLGVLAPHERRGSVHPLVSLPNPELGAQRLLDRCDFAIDGDPMMATIATNLGGRSFVVPAGRRAAYHAAATVAANHLVALCAQVEAIAALAEVPVDAYWRLMSTTLDNVSSVGAAAAITGPAARGDWATLRRHLDALPVDERGLYIEASARAARLAGRRLPNDVVTNE